MEKNIIKDINMLITEEIISFSNEVYFSVRRVEELTKEYKTLSIFEHKRKKEIAKLISEEKYKLVEIDGKMKMITKIQNLRDKYEEDKGAE